MTVDRETVRHAGRIAAMKHSRGSGVLAFSLSERVPRREVS